MSIICALAPIALIVLAQVDPNIRAKTQADQAARAEQKAQANAAKAEQQAKAAAEKTQRDANRVAEKADREAKEAERKANSVAFLDGKVAGIAAGKKASQAKASLFNQNLDKSDPASKRNTARKITGTTRKRSLIPQTKNFSV